MKKKSATLFLAIIISLGVKPSCDAQVVLKKFGEKVVGVITGAGESSIEYTKDVDKRDWDDIAKNINNDTQEEQKQTIASENESFYWLAEELPEYIGGMDAMYLFLRSELNYPRTAVKKNIQGTVLLEFVVECDGSITNVKPLVSLCPKCDKEAIRVVKKMPKWKPGIVMGKPIRCQFNLPIRFALQ